MGTIPAKLQRQQFPKGESVPWPLPDGVVGFEFVTDVPPDKGGVPDKPTWCHKPRPRPGVVIEDDFAKIKVKVRKVWLG